MSDSPDDARAPMEQAEAALAGGDAHAAWRHLRPLVAYPAQLQPDDWDDALELFGRIAASMDDDKIGATLALARSSPNDVDALYDLGFELIERDLNGFAAAALARANALAPGSARVLTELVAALERAGRHVDACAALRAEPGLVESDFVCRYLLAFNSLMTTDVSGARQLLPDLLNETDERYDGMAARIAGMLARADAIAGSSSLDRDDLRGWHFVICGGLLLHLSPWGFDAGMRGRYAYVQDSEERCLEGIRRVEAVLGALDRVPERVFLLGDRSSAILGEATAQVLQLPAEPWPEGGSDAPGLVVAYDLHATEGEALQTLADHRPGQVLWAQATGWTAPFPVAADLTTFLHEFNVAPWSEGRLRVDPESKEVSRSEAREAPLEAHANRIAGAAPEPGALDDLEALRALARAAASLDGDHAAGALRAAGRRRRHWDCSPVRSNRFA